MMKYQILESVDFPQDLKKLSVPELALLAGEIRDFLVTTVSQVGGHLAPSLGVVELTLALHYIFDAPRDKIIWDVGHQAYVHKILTGRRRRFSTLRQYGGISGFPRISESEYDVYGTGHASTAISAALGMVCARDHQQENYSVVAVVGDGAMTGGIAFEGLNNAGALGKNLIVILNDNRMAISPNVGALSRYLTAIITAPAYNKIKADIWELTGKMARVGKRIRQSARRIEEAFKAVLVPGLLFERFGFRYIGPVDGHNLSQLIKVLREVRRMSGPILVHVITIKGKGYKFAEQDARRFHGLGAFDPDTGLVVEKKSVSSYTEVFGKTLVDLASRDEKIVGITAAMPDGTGLKFFAEAYPKRFYDVGIAEQHAVTFAAGLVLGGCKPVVAIYSTFLQRAYDQLVHDVGIQNLPIVFVLDRGGLVGEDGPTHHGVFDLSYLRTIPNFVIMSPKDEAELQDMLFTAMYYVHSPVAIRYPRGAGLGVPLQQKYHRLQIGKSETVKRGTDVAILAIGSMVTSALKAAQILKKQGISVQVENMRFVKPLDTEKLKKIAQRFPLVVTVEDNILNGGFGSGVVEFFVDHGYEKLRVLRLGIIDQFIEHGAKEVLYHKLGLDAEGIANAILKRLESPSVYVNETISTKAR